ncbi:MAG: Flp pilus assembly complex ATPase component TadA, partial [Candidatus Aenigmarchaeota archaeon]|nr:Flp pilus assembly complex ATPase component TadA [Candidatus Aenigmarchaeota archaeon]
TGGYPKGSVILVSGGTGTGKTTFLSQYLWAGLKKGKKCLYITLEETPEEIKGDAIQYGWDFDKFEKDGAFRCEYFDPFELTDMSSRISDLIVVNGFTRIAIDSTSLFGMYINDEYKIRKKLYQLVESLKKSGATAVLSAEIPEDAEKKLSRFGVEEFVVDGVVVLYYTGIGDGIFRNIEIRKMRRTNHKHGVFPLDIKKDGMHVVNDTDFLK